MDRADVQNWLARYVEAWRANEAGPIEALFGEDVVYRYRPYGGADQTATGIAEILEAWLGEPDEPGSWEARYTVYVVEEDRAVATGISRYFATDTEPEQVFHNCYLLRFAEDGRCSEFTEYYMREK